MQTALNRAKAEYLAEVDHVINVYHDLSAGKMLMYLKKAGHKWQAKRQRIMWFYQGVK